MPGEHQAHGNDARQGPLRRLLVAVVVVSLTIPLAGAATGGGAVSPFVGGAAASSGAAVDVVFVFDRSASMNENRYELANELEAVHERLEARDVDARYALLTYAGTVRTEQGWTDDYDDVDSALNFRTAGHVENASDAILAATSMDFRDGVPRYVVLVTDEDDDSPADRRADATSALSGFYFVTISPEDAEVSACTAHSPPCDDDETNELRSMAGDLGGEWIDVGDDPEDIVDEAGEEIATTAVGSSSATPADGGADGADASGASGASDEDDDDGDPAFVVANVTINRTTVEVGEPVEVALTVENTGDDSGRYEATLESGNGTIESRTVGVPTGGSRTVRFVTAFPEPSRYELYVNHLDVGVVEVTPPRPTLVRTTVRDGGTTLVANVSDARTNASVAVPLADLDVASGQGGPLLNLTVTPTRDADFQVRLDTSDEPPNGTEPLPGGVRPVAYLVANSSLDAADVGGVTWEFTARAEAYTLYRYDENRSAWTPLEASSAEGGAPSAARTQGFSSFGLGVREPAFVVTGVDVEDDTPVAGDVVTVTVTVENKGSAGGSYRAMVTADGSVVATKSVSVSPDQARRVRLTFTPDSAGVYRLATGGEGGHEIQVTAAPTPTPGPTTPTVTESSGQAGFGLGVVAVLLGALALVARVHK